MVGIISFSTISPFRAPVNLKSELVLHKVASEDFSLPLRGGVADELFVDDGFIPSDTNWDSGYDSAESDDLPFFAKPILARKIEPALMPGKNVDWLKVYQMRLVSGEINLFDDTVGVLQLDYAFDGDADSLANLFGDRERRISFEKDADKAAQRFFGMVVKPQFSGLDSVLRKTVLGELVMEEQDYNVFKFGDLPIARGADTNTLLWSGRYFFCESSYDDSKAHAIFQDWVARDFPAVSSKFGYKSYMESGRGYYVSEDIATVRTSQVRGTVLAQFFFAVFYLLSHGSNRYFHQLGEVRIGSILKHTSIDKNLDHLERFVNHIDFISILFHETRHSLQSDRMMLFDQAGKAWNMDALRKSATARVDHIRRRLEEVKAKQSQALQRTIELFLGVIGGFAIVDFVLNLIQAATNGEYFEYTGLFSVTKQMPADILLYLAFALLAVPLLIFLLRRK